ncbi:hypothetical protein FQZ97_862570 [compost metagenome]
MDRADVQALGAELVEPEQRELGEQSALAGDRLAHDHVEGTDAVGRHHEDAVVAHGVVVAHLAARKQGQGFQGGGVEGGSHDRAQKSDSQEKSPVTEQSTGSEPFRAIIAGQGFGSVTVPTPSATARIKSSFSTTSGSI